MTGEALSNACDVSEIYDCEENIRLKAYWLQQWKDADTFAGESLYFLDDICVCLFSQSGRKSRGTVMWISTESRQKVRDYLLTLHEPDPLEPYDILDLDEELGASFNLTYFGSTFGNMKAFHPELGELTRYWEYEDKINRVDRYDFDYGIFKDLKGDIHKVLMADLKFNYRLEDLVY